MEGYAWQQLDISELLRIAPNLLRTPDTQYEAALHLVERVSSGEATEEQCRFIMNLLSTNLVPDIAMTDHYLDLLNSSLYPHVVIEYMYKLVVNNVKVLEALLKVYSRLAHQSRDCLMPILESLMQISPPDKLRRAAFKISVNALSFIDEGDLPVAIKALFSFMTKELMRDGIRALRTEIEKLNFEVLVCALDVIFDILMASLFLSYEVLKEVQKSHQFRLLDLFVLIVLMASQNFKVSKFASEVFYDALEERMLDLRLLGHVLRVSMDTFWLHENPMVFLGIAEQFITFSSNPVLCSWTQGLFVHLFVHFPKIRPAILATLFSMAIHPQEVVDFKFNFRFKSPHLEIRNFQHDCLFFNEKSRSSAAAMAAIFHLSLYYRSALESFSHVLEDFLTQGSFTNFGLDSSDGKRVISVLSTHCICRSMTLLSESSSTVLNGLMIYIQKYCATGNIHSQTSAYQIASHLVPSLQPVDRHIITASILRRVDSIPREAMQMVLNYFLSVAFYLDQEDLKVILEGFLTPLMVKFDVISTFGSALSKSDTCIWNVPSMVKWHIKCRKLSIFYSPVLVQLILESFVVYTVLCFDGGSDGGILAGSLRNSLEFVNRQRNSTHSEYLLLESYYGLIVSRSISNAILRVLGSDIGESSSTNWMECGLMRFTAFSGSSGLYELLWRWEEEFVAYEGIFRDFVSRGVVAKELKVNNIFMPFRSYLMLLHSDLRFYRGGLMDLILGVMIRAVVLYLVNGEMKVDYRAMEIQGDELYGYGEHYLDVEPIFVSTVDAVFNLLCSVSHGGDSLKSVEYASVGAGMPFFFRILVRSDVIRNLVGYNAYLARRLSDGDAAVDGAIFIAVNVFLTYLLAYCRQYDDNVLKMVIVSFGREKCAGSSSWKADDFGLPGAFQPPIIIDEEEVRDQIGRQCEVLMAVWNGTNDLFLDYSILLHLQQLYTSAGRREELVELVYMTLKKKLRAGDWKLSPIMFPIEFADDSLWPIVSYRDYVFRYFVVVLFSAGDTMKIILERGWTIFEAMADKGMQLAASLGEVDDGEGHCIFASLTLESLPSFVTSTMQCCLNYMKNCSIYGNVAHDEDPISNLTGCFDLISVLFKLLAICVCHSRKKSICTLRGFLLAVVEVGGQIKEKLEICIQWRSGIRRPSSMPANTLTPLFSRVFQMISELRVLVSVLKGFHPDFQHLFQLKETDLRLMPKVSNILERGQDVVTNLSRRHHVQILMETNAISQLKDKWLRILRGIERASPSNYGDNDTMIDQGDDPASSPLRDSTDSSIKSTKEEGDHDSDGDAASPEYDDYMPSDNDEDQFEQPQSPSLAKPALYKFVTFGK